MVFRASCRSLTKRRSVLPTLNWVCTISRARWLCRQRLREDSLAVARGQSPPTTRFRLRRTRAGRPRRRSATACFCSTVLICDLGLERAASVDRREQAGAEVPHRVVVVLEHEELARDAADAGRERDRRQSRRLRLADAVERGGDAPLGGDDIGPALEQLRREARRVPRPAAAAAAALTLAAAAG